jgi:hypothetical protein
LEALYSKGEDFECERLVEKSIDFTFRLNIPFQFISGFSRMLIFINGLYGDYFVFIFITTQFLSIVLVLVNSSC